MHVLDPSIFCGTGTPEAGGVTFDELRKAVTLVCSELDIVGCDVNELSPHYDQSGTSTAVACKIIREMLLGRLRQAHDIFSVHTHETAADLNNLHANQHGHQNELYTNPHIFLLQP